MVIADFRARLVHVRYHALLVGQVVRVGHPAYLVGEVFVVVGEVGRAPAVDRVANVLLRTNHDREDDEYESGVLVVEAIDDVIVASYFDVADATRRAQ